MFRRNQNTLTALFTRLSGSTSGTHSPLGTSKPTRRRTDRRVRAVCPEQLESRQLLTGFDLESVFAIGNGTNATSAQGGVRIDDFGNSYVSGYFEGVVDFDAGQTHPGDADILTSVGAGRDLFVAKYDSNDHLLWALPFGSANTLAGKEEVINGFAIDADGNAYAVGKFQDTLTLGTFSIASAGGDDGFLIKINSAGESQWASQWGTAIIEAGNDVAVSATGDVYVVGKQDVDTTSNVGTTEVRKFDPAAGTVAWVKSVESGSYASMIAVDSVGNVNIASTFGQSFDADPGPGQVIITDGNAERTTVSTYAIQLDSNGNLNWARGLEMRTPADPSRISQAISYGLAVDKDDNVVIVGGHAGRVDFDPSVVNVVELSDAHSSFVVKLSSAGDFQWVRGVTGSHILHNKDLQFDSANNLILAGYIDGYGETLDFDPDQGTANLTPYNNGSTIFDSYIWSLTEAGEFRSITHLAKANEQSLILGIALDSSDRLHAVGSFSGTVDFDPSSGVNALSASARSAFSMRLNAKPGVTVNRRVGQVTSESASSTSFSVSLDSRPTQDVFVPISSNDLSEGTVNVSGLTFTPLNWNIPQVVTVSSVDDAQADGDVAYSILLGVLLSNDPAYAGLNPVDVTITNLNDDIPTTKFYVVDDASANRTFEYTAEGSAVENYSLNSGNLAPRGAASTVAGDKVWVVDANRKVYVYNNSGSLLGSWTAGSVASNATIEGITTNGTDVWLVDARQDRVYRYANAAGRLSGSLNAASSFAVNSGNRDPKDIVTDGTNLWLVNDSTTDRVFRYTMSGSLVGSWTIDSANKAPTGLTIDPSGASQSIWIVDNGTDRVYEYANSRSRNSGSLTASVTFALSAGNTNPQGIADPPPASSAEPSRVVTTNHALVNTYSGTAIPSATRASVASRRLEFREGSSLQQITGTFIENAASEEVATLASVEVIGDALTSSLPSTSTPTSDLSSLDSYFGDFEPDLEGSLNNSLQSPLSGGLKKRML
jgi:hypothetical protein